jgi:hypothetical protein
VARDNTVTFGKLHIQIAKQPGRVSCAGRTVLVREHLGQRNSIWLGGQCLGRYDARGLALPPDQLQAARAKKPPSHSVARPEIVRCASRARGQRRAATHRKNKAPRSKAA